MLIRLSRIFTFFFVTGILGFIGFRIYSEKFASKEKIPNNVKIYLITDSVRYKADDIYWNARASIEKGNWRNVYLAIHHLDRLIASTGYDDAKIYRTALQGSVLAMKGNYIKALDCHLEVLDFVKDKNYFAHMLYGYRELIKICKILKMPEEVKKYEHAQKLLLFQTQVPPLETIRLKDSVERCRHENPYMAAIVAKELFYTSRNRGDLKGMGRAQYTLGYVLITYKKDYVNGLNKYQQALSIYEHIRNSEGIALCYMGIGMVYARHKLYDAALLSYNKSLAWFKVIENKEEEATVLRQIGLLYWDKKDYDLAIDNFNQSLQRREINDDKKGIAQVYNSLGITYEDKGDLSQAKMYYEQSIAMSQAINAQRQLANALNNLGLLYKKRGNYELAINYLSKSLTIEEYLKNNDGLARSYSSIGFTHLESGKYTEAIEWLMKGKKIAKDELDDKKLVIDINIDIATAYEKLGNVNQAQSFKQEAEELRDEFESDQKRLMRRENRMQKRIEKEAHGFMYDEQRKSSCDTMFQKINNLRPLFKFIN